MKHAIVLVIVLLGFAAPNAFGAGDSLFTLGINWMHTDSTYTNFAAVHRLFDSTIACNTYHSASNLQSQTQDINWAQRSKIKMIQANFGHTIDDYSGAERIQYMAANYHGTDSLVRFYFGNFGNVGYNFPPAPATPTHRAADSVLPTASHPDTLLLSGNQFSTEWRDPAGTKLYLAVKLQVAALTTDNTKDAISIRVKQIHGGTTKIDTIHIKWKQFTQTNTDQVIVDTSDAITVPTDFAVTYDLLQLEVYSPRWVTVRISWITIEDTRARNLRSALDYNRSNSYWNNLSDSICNAAAADRDTIIKKFKTVAGDTLLKYFYLRDEPPVAEYESMGMIDSVLGYKGITEIEGVNNRRFARMVHPPVIWSGGITGVSYQVSAVYDKGMDEAFDSCGGHCFSHDSLQRTAVKNVQWGYFPHNNTGGYLTAQQYAAQRDSIDFDHFDLRRGGFITTKINENIQHAIWADSAIYYASDGSSRYPQEWWANVFSHAHLCLDFSDFAYYYDNNTATFQQTSCATHLSLALGAKALMFYTGLSLDSCDAMPGNHSYICTGFVSDTGKWNSDTVTYHNTSMPVLHKSRTNWLIKFSNWLRNYAYPLKSAKWLGGFARNSYEYYNTHSGHGDTLYFAGIHAMTRSIGTNPLVDASHDSSTRPILKTWPGGALPTYTPWDSTTIVKDTTLADSLCMVVYGFFQDTIAKSPSGQKNKYFLYCVNLYSDPRDLVCRYNPSDSISAQRGCRTIFTKMNLDPHVATFWKITTLDSNKRDTIVRYDGRLRARYQPGEGRVFTVTPYLGSDIGDEHITYSNGRKMEFDGAHYHVTYCRNDSVFYKRSLDATTLAWGGEQLIAPDTNLLLSSPPGTHGWNAAWKGDHSSIRLVAADSTGTAFQTIIAYEIETSTTFMTAVRANNPASGTAWYPSQEIGRYTKPTTVRFRPFPSLAPYRCGQNNFGAVVAWSNDVSGIALRSVNVSGGSPNILGTTVYVDARTNADHKVVNDSIPDYPSIVEDPDHEQFGLAFEQDQQIFFDSVHFSCNDISHVLNLQDTIPEWVSKPGSGCDNLHPCIDVDHWHDSVGGSCLPVPSFHIVWDSPIDYVQETPAPCPCAVSFSTVRAVYQAVRYPLSPRKYDYTMFHGKYSQVFPSVRSYDGYYGTSNPCALPKRNIESAIITWFGSDSLTHYASDSNQVVGKTTWKLNRFDDSSKTPNLDVRGHDLAAFKGQRSAFRHILPNKVRALVDSILNLSASDTAVAATYLQTKPINVCPRIFVFVNPRITPDTIKPTIVPMTIPISPVRDSIKWSQGVRAITDTLRVTALNKNVRMPYTKVIEDTVGVATWLGSTGRIKYYLEAADWHSDTLLLRADSLIVSTTTLQSKQDTLRADMTSLVGDTVYLRIKVTTLNVDSAITNVALSIAPRDTGGAAGFGKQAMHYFGRAGLVPEEVNPIALEVFPNPSSSGMKPTVSFTIPVEDADDIAEVKVFDMLARDVSTLVHDFKPAGRFQVTFDGTLLPAGRYIVAVHLKTHQQSKLIILNR